MGKRIVILLPVCGKKDFPVHIHPIVPPPGKEHSHIVGPIPASRIVIQFDDGNGIQDQIAAFGAIPQPINHQGTSHGKCRYGKPGPLPPVHLFQDDIVDGPDQDQIQQKNRQNRSGGGQIHRADIPQDIFHSVYFPSALIRIL